MGLLLRYALDSAGNLVHVDDVPNGKKCKCICRYCNSPLNAKNKGIVKTHHFAHAHGQECEGAYESAIHLLAKEILQETGRIMLPKTNDLHFPSGFVRIHNVEIEKWDERLGIRPDVEAIMDNGERLLIELYVSHKVDSMKRQIIVDHHLKCIEININFQILDKGELKKFLTDTDEKRKWIVSIPPPKPKCESHHSKRNPIYEKTRDVLKEIFDKGTITIHPKASSNFNLRDLGYDVCEVNTKFLGFKSDLLLYRSQKEDKGYISINIRGRSRWEYIDRPKSLRVIDIVFSAPSQTEEGSRRRLNNGDLTGDRGMDVEYFGFK